ncbi:MAG: hypothetical protein LBE92_15495 [Chryseobacterium sp.]|jgi:hypothetical protein|uniref:hypothetical protein n=1 Tax=Chryseobacterium sp. TaxID=1871047 RepID=UPI00283A63D6|nr:hypothetical protein [Chryseobacterium sp.]MDR2237524.1 hypothetical protein [Chryseobacterium sp.]
MNTFRDNLEQRIRKQIEEREVAPSRDLWTEIEMQTPAGSAPSKFKVNRFLAAACVLLAFGLGFVLFFNTKKDDPKTHNIVERKPEAPQKETPVILNEDTKPVLAEQKHNGIPEINKTSAQPANEIPASKAIAEEIHKVSVKEKTLPTTPVIPQIPVEKILAKAEDSSKTPGKKKRYVDPSTLLFSVEHKDIIQKTKESNVATVDLNGK